ncbi:MAG: hypothetical protein M1822_001391 [Bathelium mastoideum]|nr:MAG: hypothetical protein M1822_001391 [Bathelium mastoideum]
MDCSTGREKIGLAKQYWKALIAELELCLLLANESSLSFAETSFDLSRAIQESQRRVPLMFKTLKDILRSILPEVDHAQIDDVLDVPIIMQQTQRGNFDLACLSRWLSKLLKTHCAPMRDKWVDKMVMLMGDGAETACAQSIVDGFRELLGILEAMKLDVANHQVRHLRTIFVEDTIRFEQRYHQGQFFDVKDAQQWLARNILQQKALPSLREVRLPEKLTALVYAILQTLLSSAASRVYFPHIFSLDLDRLASLRAGLLDQVHLNICLFIYKDLLKLSRAFPSSSSLTSESALQQALLIIIGPTKATHENPSRRWLAHIPNLAVHLVRAAFPFLSSSCAPTLLETTEYNLAASLQPSSPIFQRAATALFHALLPPLLADVAAHVDSSPLVLSNTFVPTLPPSTLAPTPSSISAGLEGRGMATGGQWRLDEGDKRLQVLRWRLAHVAVLHWQVWAPLVYLVDGDAVNGEVEKGGARNGAEN